MVNFSHESGLDISRKPDFFEILRREWGVYAPRDIEQFDTILRNADAKRGNGIISLYVDNEPGFILRTLMLEAESPEDIPSTFDELTGKGTWSTYRPTGQTRVLVDFANSIGVRGLGYAHDAFDYMMDLIRDTTNHLWTYSPITAASFHIRHGAKHTRLINNARPDYSVPDVAIMSYK